ncbi:ATP-dependent RNA helicase dbp10 [Scheffersomyces spartinae]|uniref:ATP-dependent RNA helicase DBP10 n=1 Tax=Scheffersomyces spartinae TaxID=45513 RepID=A0A9P7V728_9ASCO|nr:ATP-dependent RNA helicase dbp10 [Scheffersomyces spartinae]KAG7192575.1 ATP-dependent RNA helicase dbp10 [Scheffersomyces spartinae]
MSSDEEDYDIAGSLAVNAEDSDYSDSESDNDNQEFKDIILSDNEEEEEEQEQPQKKKQKKETKTAKPKSTVKPEAFPNLELSDDEEDDKSFKATTDALFLNNPEVKKAKSGTFKSFGLSQNILRNIAKRGYKNPTPIQRKSIPLLMEGRDVVGMARTGSGKTAAFTLPVVDKLRQHSAKVGIRALILSPSRELALQTYKQVKDFSKGTDLRSVVLIGGDSLEDQFQMMMNNPDIVVATPGRFLHLKVEMELDLKTIEFAVFDEADRLFEMGFAEQLNELIASMPTSRQSLLFSATLPRTLVDFAKAGLVNPVLVRLDAESKISDELEMAFFTTKKNEREANLLYILQNMIKVPIATSEDLKKLKEFDGENDDSDPDNNDDGNDDKNKKTMKRKRFTKRFNLPPANVLPSPYSTIVFVPTKHHVEYITALLKDAGYLVSYIYGTLDQHARKSQLYQFRAGLTNVLVVTDVAARGIDIPVLAYVINFSLPASSKIFIHRVGRTARAGNKGWAYLIVNEKELPYLLDLELFLGKKVLLTSMHEAKCELLKERQGDQYVEPKVSYTDRLVLGSVPRLQLENCQELYDNLLANNYELSVIKDVSLKGEKLYQRTRQPASQESVKRTKELIGTGTWDEQHLLFGANLEKEKDKFLAKLMNRNVKETVFEFKHKGREREENSMAEFMQRRRRQLAPIQRKAKERKDLLDKERQAGLVHGIEEEVLKGDSSEVGYSTTTRVGGENLDEEELQQTFEDGDSVLNKKKNNNASKSYRDPQFYMSHYAPTSVIQDQQLSLATSFANSAASATFDLDNDEKMRGNKQVMQWDRKKGKYVNSLSTDKKYIISENGQRIPASFRSGKFDDWKKQRNLQPAKAGSLEPNNDKNGNKRFKHKKVDAPRLPDKYRDDFHKQKKKVEKALESGVSVKGYNRPGQRQELKTTEQIRKDRELKEKRKAKNARPSRKKKY